MRGVRYSLNSSHFLIVGSSIPAEGLTAKIAQSISARSPSFEATTNPRLSSSSLRAAGVALTCPKRAILTGPDVEVVMG
jgi:hypothetical protein